ncbi:MAG: HEAT repeat domain-containing protein [Deltaproteobacteria bacterium]|nr:HEAT repeat domain-containing protein [Deltaproteobacteria bacterium]
MRSLESKNEDIHYHAVCAAGNWGLDAAWPHIGRLLASDSTDKSLRLAAIEAVANIRPGEAAEILLNLTQSDDEDFVEAAYEAMSMSGALTEEDFENDDYDDPDNKLLSFSS